MNALVGDTVAVVLSETTCFLLVACLRASHFALSISLCDHLSVPSAPRHFSSLLRSFHIMALGFTVLVMSSKAEPRGPQMGRQSR